MQVIRRQKNGGYHRLWTALYMYPGGQCGFSKDFEDETVAAKAALTITISKGVRIARLITRSIL